MRQNISHPQMGPTVKQDFTVAKLASKVLAFAEPGYLQLTRANLSYDQKS